MFSFSHIVYGCVRWMLIFTQSKVLLYITPSLSRERFIHALVSHKNGQRELEPQICLSIILLYECETHTFLVVPLLVADHDKKSQHKYPDLYSEQVQW